MKSLINNSFPVLASKQECTGCMACLDSCSAHAISSYNGPDGHKYVKVDNETCIGCKKCEKICALSRGYYGENDLSKSYIYAAWNTNPSERANATSGGVFAAIAHTVLKKNGVVVGATLDGRECYHILIRSVDELSSLQGSKYMASSMEGIYKTIEREIDKGIVLFSGVACQCAGVLAYFENHKNAKNLITMDLICGGSPSKILLDKFYERYPDVEQIVSFREKDRYKLKVLKEKKIVAIDEKSLPLDGFNCDMTSRLCCYDCKFAVAHRKTDFTIGDLWDYKIFPEEHAKGISTLIVHSDKGNQILDEKNIELHPVNWESCVRSCRRIVYGKRHIFSPRKKLIENAKSMSYEEFLKLYCIDMKPQDIRMFLFRIYRYLYSKVEFWIIDKKIKGIVSSINSNR